MREDRELIREFSRHGSETAFRALVERHVKLVYSAALRVVNGDAHLAQDISQLVFSKLARKARSLPADVVLAGWLHRDTRFTALELLRKERRRGDREKEAAIMHELELPATEWSRLRPMLDEILDELGEEDRHALLLRYFEQRNLAEVGAGLGLAEDAARKRVNRALDRLRSRLAVRGVTTTASALSVVLIAHGVETIPPGLTLLCAGAALATVGTATASTVGFLGLISSAKAGALVVTSTAFLLLGGAVVKSYVSTSREELPEATVVAEPTLPQPTRSPAARVGVAKKAGIADTDPDLVAALARVQAVLDNPKPRRNGVNPEMESAIAGLGDHRQAAVPMLRAAVRSPDSKTRQQATEGLGLIGVEARDAVLDVMDMLRASSPRLANPPPNYRSSVFDAGASANALRQIGAPPETIYELARILKENPATREGIVDSFEHGMFADQANTVGEAFRPLLQDPDPDVRRAAAFAIAKTLHAEAGLDVIRVAIEAIKAGTKDLSANDAGSPSEVEDHNRRLRNEALLGNAFAILAYAGADSAGRTRPLTAANFGPAADDAASAFVEIVKNTKQGQATRETALGFLDSLNPNLEKEPETAAILGNYRQFKALISHAMEGRATVSELLDGLKQDPKQARVFIYGLSSLGASPESVLPAFRAALVDLDESKYSSSTMDGNEAWNARHEVADAIEKMAPNEPKPLFTLAYDNPLNHLMHEMDTLPDPVERQKISMALGPLKSKMEVTHDQMVQLLDKLKGVDQPMYEAFAKQVKVMDPKFFTKPTP